MKKSSIVAVTSFVIASGIGSIPAGAQSSDAPITVIVNNNAMNFTGSPAIEMNGSVLVPLRGIFEQLGANVDYNSTTRTIEAVRGTTDVILRLGESTAYVNGTPEPLAQPAATMNGTTLVPLRFVAEAFGAQVSWDAPSQTVNIVGGMPVASTPPPIAPPRSLDVYGQLAGVYPDTNPPQVVVSNDHGNVAVPVNGDTVVLIQRGTDPAVQADLGALRVGDHVKVSRDTPDGPATIVKASYSIVRGTVSNILRLADGSHVITFDDGTNIQVAPGSSVTQNDTAANWDDIHPGKVVEVRNDPHTQIGYGVRIAGDQPRPPMPGDQSGPAATIDSFTVDTPGPLKGGDSLRVTLRGTPGSKAAFAVPSVADDVPMTESAPGVYSGTFIVPADANVNEGSVIGRLTSPNSTPVLIQAAQTVTIDSKPPTISDVSPSEMGEVSNARPRISAVLDDGAGSGVDPNATRMSVDGIDVTGDAIVTNSFITYAPRTPLPDGEHRIHVITADMVGNPAGREWRIVINARKGLVTSLTSNLTDANSHLYAGQPLHVVMTAQTGGKASFAVGNVANGIPLIETSAGTYEGDYVPQPGSNIQNAPIVATFAARNGSIVTTTLDQAVTIDAGVPRKPRIKSPQPDDLVPGHVVIEGVAAPNATVLVQINYRSPALGGLITTNGKAASTQVQADPSGHWRTDDLKLSSGGGLFATAKGTTYTATATVIDATGQQSDSDSVSFRQQ